MSVRHLPSPLLPRVLLGLLTGCALPAPPAPETPPAVEPAQPPGAAQSASTVEAEEAVPTGRLPEVVVPLGYTLELTVLPERDRFQGRTQIVVDIKEPRSRIWLHGLNLDVEAVTATVGDYTVLGSYRQVNDDGLSAVEFERTLPVTRAILTFRYSAPFDRTLRGLYRVDQGEDHYAFTQFEPYSARLVFPGFDEPAFKTPFDVWLTIRDGQVGIANGPEESREELGDGFVRLRFKRTQPLPTYLVALAVGPLDIVEAPDLPPSELRRHAVPLRGIAARGKGKRLAYALRNTPKLVNYLERYFGIPYPYDKLDLIAVPDFAAGAMENAGAITFREWLLLLDKRRANQSQKRAFAYVMAHELAHQWFGNLVTMPWWDDIWLNEAFATWMGFRAVQDVWPRLNASLDFLEQVHSAMDEDSLVSARMIRQPIDSTHDIVSAFDSITYRKGGGVLSMFERYLGEERFRDGIRKYLKARPFGNATAEDLLAALSSMTEKDLTTPFNTFLEQAGVPLVRVQVRCEESRARLSLAQERYLPVGSHGSRIRKWQVPVCVRYGTALGNQESQCTLLDRQTGEIPIATGCPTWVMPNADAAGYYLWSLPGDDLSSLIENGFERLSTEERMSLARALEAGLEAGTLTASDALSAFEKLARGKARPVVTAPMGMLEFMHEYVVAGEERERFEAYARRLYAPLVKRLGFGAQDREGRDGGRRRRRNDGETKLLRSAVLAFLADVGRSAEVRERLARMGAEYIGVDGALRRDAVPQDLTDLAVRIALEDGGADIFERALTAFRKSDDAAARRALLGGLSSVRDKRSKRALRLSLDESLRVNEVIRPLWGQMADRRTRKAAWAWFVANFDKLSDRLSARGMAYTTHLAEPFCSEAFGERVQNLFAGRIEKMDGGPRNLAKTLESMRLCDARVQALRTSTADFLRTQDQPTAQR